MGELDKAIAKVSAGMDQTDRDIEADKDFSFVEEFVMSLDANSDLNTTYTKNRLEKAQLFIQRKRIKKELSHVRK